MLKNYWKVAFRNIWKHKIFSAINIGGLAIGMAACLLILQYVNFKLSFDQFNEHADDIYRVIKDRFQDGKLIQHGTITYSSVGKAMNDDFDEVIDNARIPLAGLVMHWWPRDFTYRVDLSWWIFATAGGVALFLALVTISVQTFKTALLSLIKTLRSD